MPLATANATKATHAIELSHFRVMRPIDLSLLE